MSLPTAFSQETCLRRGLCPVSVLRHEKPAALFSHSIYYEQHGVPGTDPVKGAKHKLVFIMGLNATCFGWEPQIRYFRNGGQEGNCTALVFDNRGVGNSDYPRGPYSTSAMAEDIICLLDNLGWTEDRELNVVGISLGGMIAQELAYRIPRRICSLVLTVTTPGGFALFNLPPWKGLLGLTRMFFTSDPQQRIPIALDMIFPKKWLAERAEIDPLAEMNGNTKGNEQGKTNYQTQKEQSLFRYSISKPQLILGNLSQMVAGLTHNVCPERLAFIAANIPKIAIVTGDDDNLVHPSGSERIKAAMDRGASHEDSPRVELLKWEGVGHAIHIQCEIQLNEVIERCAKEGRALIENGWTGKNT